MSNDLVYLICPIMQNIQFLAVRMDVNYKLITTVIIEYTATANNQDLVFKKNCSIGTDAKLIHIDYATL